MEEHKLYEIPYGYRLCLNRECSKAPTCLRQMAEQKISDSVKFWSVISPKYQAALEGECPYYRVNEKIIYAKGFIGMLDNMPNKHTKRVIPYLIREFGQRTYYRVRKGERLLDPSEQQEILTILKKCGVEEPPRYDAYVEDYAW